MTIGLSSKAFPANMSIPQGLRLAKRSSFDSVELDISEAGYLTLDADEKAVRFLRGAVENMSLEVGSVRADLLEDLTSPSDYVSALRRCVEISIALGADVLSLPLGHGAPALGDLKESIVGVIGLAEEFGLALALEWTPDGIEAAKEFVDGIGADCVGVCVDTGSDQPTAWVRAFEDRVKLVRARDYCRCAAGDVFWSNLLEGEVDWKDVRKALLEIGYEGSVIAQVPGYRQYGELGIKHCGENMKRVFGASVKGRE